MRPYHFGKHRTSTNTAFQSIQHRLPRFGKSQEPPYVWGIEEYTQAVEHFFKSEQIDNPILLGHSFGGRVGILLASRNKVKKLILVDAAGIKPRRSLAYYFKVYTYKIIKHALPVLCGKRMEKSF